jgi:hypothetical protein
MLKSGENQTSGDGKSRSWAVFSVLGDEGVRKEGSLIPWNRTSGNGSGSCMYHMYVCHNKYITTSIEYGKYCRLHAT